MKTSLAEAQKQAQKFAEEYRKESVLRKKIHNDLEDLKVCAAIAMERKACGGWASVHGKGELVGCIDPKLA